MAANMVWSYLVGAVGQNKDFAVSIFSSTKLPGVQWTLSQRLKLKPQESNPFPKIQLQERPT